MNESTTRSIASESAPIRIGDREAVEAGMLIAALLSTSVASGVHAILQFEDTARSPSVRAERPYNVISDRADLNAIARIRELGMSEDGWKGAGSVGPGRGAVKDAVTFARTYFSEDGLEAPHIGLAADGEINFYWKMPRVSIDLSIFGDGTYSYSAQPTEGKPISDDDVPVGTLLPRELLEMLRKTG